MTKLHIGCGPHILPGWVNIDNVRYKGISKKLDVTKGLPFKNVSFIFAEHFIEHLPYPKAAALFRECRRVLNDGGVLRLSTPSLDWVWISHYRDNMNAHEQAMSAFLINRAFRGWSHQFLYNEGALRAALTDAGFANVKRVEYGNSEHDELRGLERHELSPPYGSFSSILIVEASGRGGEKMSSDLERMRVLYERDIKSK